METNRLRQFCTIVETESMSKSADLLGISLSGLSRSIQILQEQLDIDLIMPQGRGIVVTEKGRDLYPKAKLILESIDGLKDTAIDQQKMYKLVCTEVFTHNLIPLIAKQLDGQVSQIMELPPQHLELSILNRQFDFGITYLPFSMEGIEHLAFSKIKLGAFKKVGTFKNYDTKEIPFILPSSALQQNPMGIKSRDGWPQSLWARKYTYKTNNLSTALSLAQIGEGAVLIPKFVAENLNTMSDSKHQLEEIKLPCKQSLLTSELFLTKRIETQENMFSKKLISFVKGNI